MWSGNMRRRWLGLSLVAFILFLLTGFAVISGSTENLDRSVLLAIRQTDPASVAVPVWVQQMISDLTGLGSVTALIVLTMIAAGWALAVGASGTARFITISVGGAMLINPLAKMLVGRPRPDLAPHGDTVYTASFPSGHAFLSLTVYAVLALVIARRGRALSYSLIVAGLLALLIGISRIMLAVHWPSDVVAGWLLGLAWIGLMAGLAGSWIEESVDHAH